MGALHYEKQHRGIYNLADGSGLIPLYQWVTGRGKLLGVGVTSQAFLYKRTGDN
jgi:hypothetical protein